MQAAQCRGYHAQLPTSAPGFVSQLGCECVMQYAETGKSMHEAIFFFASKPCITVRVGAAMPAWGDSNYVAAAF